jgi:hypothetical protein
MKKAAASRYLMWTVVVAAVLFLPWGNLAAAGTPAGGCHPGQGFGPGLVAGQCCCFPGTPGHCGACNHSGMFTCRCGSVNPAVVGPPAADMPTWQVSPYGHPMITVALPVFPPSIFHPPEPSHLSCRI